MTRKECYAFIKANPTMKENCFKCNNINYTQLKTEELEDWINHWITECTPMDESVPEETKYVDDFSIEYKIINRLCDVLISKKIILKKERDYILGI